MLETGKKYINFYQRHAKFIAGITSVGDVVWKETYFKAGSGPGCVLLKPPTAKKKYFEQKLVVSLFSLSWALN